MPIPDADRAVVNREKVYDYLLNPDHPEGGSKAAWFQSIGYERQNWQTLAKDLLALGGTCDRFDTESSVHGVKYKASGVLSQPGHRPGQVMTVWIIEDDEPPRLVTAYPNDSP